MSDNPKSDNSNLVAGLLLSWSLAALASALLAALLLAAPLLAAEETPAFRIYLSQPGVYRVSYEDLHGAGLPTGNHNSGSLRLSHRGEDIPVWIADGGDGSFGPGDAFEFVGEILHGEGAYFHPHSPTNVYNLSWDASGGRRMSATVSAENRVTANALRRHLHLEEDRLLIRIAHADATPPTGSTARSGTNSSTFAPPETWYWVKMTHIDAESFRVGVDLSDLDPTAAVGVSIRLHFRAISQSRSTLPGHRVEVALNGAPVGAAEWDGKTPYLLQLPELDPAAFAPHTNELELRVPRRIPEGGSDPLIDVVMLNWIEVSYPYLGRVNNEQVRFEVMPEASGGTMALTSPEATRLILYGDKGNRIETRSKRKRFLFQPMAGESSYHAVPDQRLHSPEKIEFDRPSGLKTTTKRADYLMIAHPRLIETAQPLADFHRRRGLAVALVDIQDIYDEFNHGIVHPRALRDFVAHAYHRWEKPAPLFVLLIGDASWDVRNPVDDANYANWTDRQLLDGDRFRAKKSAVYPETPELPHRNLIPTGSYSTRDGRAANDNFFVAVAGDDHLPDLAIGRFPITEPAELKAIVDKTISYVDDPEIGPWRRQILWITDDRKWSKNLSENLSSATTRRGFDSFKVYPRPEEPDNAKHQEHLRQVFDQGQLLVHFYGHGGRYIWRTGPPDYRKNHDLFTLQDLENLAPTRRLPVVLSMTCFSAPFDHPNADSIGEFFLRLRGRGAIAVLGASWRNSPDPKFSTSLMHYLSRPGTIGEAVMQAKRDTQVPMMVETYALLGDPAVPVAAPSLVLQLEPATGPGPAVSATIPAELMGAHAIVDWLDTTDEVVLSQETTINGRRFEALFEGTPDQAVAVRAARLYVWDSARAIDGLGRVELPAPPAIKSTASSP